MEMTPVLERKPYSNPFKYVIALSTKRGSTQRGGLRWIETWPPKSPNTFSHGGR